MKRDTKRRQIPVHDISSRLGCLYSPSSTRSAQLHLCRSRWPCPFVPALDCIGGIIKLTSYTSS